MSKTILIVEDHEGNASTFRDYILTFFPKWIIFTALSGQEAVTQTIEHSPDVIILDIALADKISGIRVVKEVAKTDKKPRIILITALDDYATDGPRPGRPWIEQFEENERPLVAGFFQKSRLKWADFITAIAKAADVPVPEGIENL
jgi:CheY-like chemotaxis protein